MLKLVVAVDPRLHTEARDFVRVAQVLDRRFVRLLFHAQNVTGFQTQENRKKP
jgi:hypothetical protein